MLFGAGPIHRLQSKLLFGHKFFVSQSNQGPGYVIMDGPVSPADLQSRFIRSGVRLGSDYNHGKLNFVGLLEEEDREEESPVRPIDRNRCSGF